MTDPFLIVCESLSSLAILKNQKVSEETIASVAKFLLRDFKHEDVNKACGYFAKRLERFPDVSHFFNLMAPMRSVEEQAEREIGNLIGLIGQGYDNAKDKFTDIQKDLLTVWSWSELSRCKESELSKIRINMTFYLRGQLNSVPSMKITESNRAILENKGFQQLEGE